MATLVALRPMHAIMNSWAVQQTLSSLRLRLATGPKGLLGSVKFAQFAGHFSVCDFSPRTAMVIFLCGSADSGYFIG